MAKVPSKGLPRGTQAAKQVVCYVVFAAQNAPKEGAQEAPKIAQEGPERGNANRQFEPSAQRGLQEVPRCP
eukprot:9500243-Pyramimonas_sp.AAC.1